MTDKLYTQDQLDWTKLDTYNDRPPWKQYYTKFMLAWAVLAHSWLLVQIVEILTSKNVEGLSILAFSILVTSNIVWFIYGYAVLPKRNYVIMTSGAVSFTLAMTTIALIFIYKDNDGDVDNADDTTRLQKRKKKKRLNCGCGI